MGLGNLKKGNRKDTENRAKEMISPDVRDKEAQNFISGAKKRVEYSNIPVKPKIEKPKPNKYIFTLPTHISDEIDKLSLLSRTTRINRSDVIQAAIQEFLKMPEDKIVERLHDIKDI